jgi:hypothetical protein
VHADEGKHQAPKVLHKKVKRPKAFRVLARLNFRQGPNLAAVEANVLVAEYDLQLLSSNTIWLRPRRVVLPAVNTAVSMHREKRGAGEQHGLSVIGCQHSLKNFTLFDDSLGLLEYGLAHAHFFSDHSVIFIVAIVGIAQPAVGAKLKLHELVPELPFVPSAARRRGEQSSRLLKGEPRREIGAGASKAPLATPARFEGTH